MSTDPALTRRALLARGAGGLGLLAMNGLLPAGEPTPAGAWAARPPHVAAKAKSVIWLMMEGGPSAVDLFDPKPELQRRHGQTVAGIETHFGKPGPLMRSPYSFKQHGQSGLWVCDKLPALARCADDLAMIKSVWTESSNHAPAMYQMNTGMPRPGFPSVGSWIGYGLGTPNQDLPGFVVMSGGVMKGGSLNWSAGFLPGAYQGTLLRSGGAPVLDLVRPKDLTAARQGELLTLTAALNAEHRRARPGPAESDLDARSASFDLAARMQSAVPGVADLAKEDAATRTLYGLDRGGRAAGFGTKCLLARRLVERGVRFVQLYPQDEWDAHNDLNGNHNGGCGEIDVPIAGLLTDLKRRGLLDSTLVVWGGEFGRMPVSEQGGGRDHNPHGFLMWMAGAGIKAGASHGATDEIGWKAAVDPVSVHDVHATILHLLGLDHRRLTWEHNGRRFRLTDTSGTVIRNILA